MFFGDKKWFRGACNLVFGDKKWFRGGKMVLGED